MRSHPTSSAQPDDAREHEIPPEPSARDRLAAIARGESFVSEAHAARSKEEPVLDVEEFRLWYGQKQALFDDFMCTRCEVICAANGAKKSRSVIRRINGVG